MIKFFTFAHHRPDFIYMQDFSFRKNCVDGYNLTVFDNAVFDSPEKSTEIRGVSRACGAEVVDVRYDEALVRRCQQYETLGPIFIGGRYTSANVACAYPLVWAWENRIRHEKGPVCIIHSDVFLTCSARLSALANEADLCFVPQGRPGGIEYMWECFAFLNMAALPRPEEINWWCANILGTPVDVGGQTHYYLKAYRDRLRIKHIHERHAEDDSAFLSIDGREFAMHYGRGSNWNHQTPEFHRQKTQRLRRILGC